MDYIFLSKLHHGNWWQITAYDEDKDWIFKLCEELDLDHTCINCDGHILVRPMSDEQLKYFEENIPKNIEMDFID